MAAGIYSAVDYISKEYASGSYRVFLSDITGHTSLEPSLFWGDGGEKESLVSTVCACIIIINKWTSLLAISCMMSYYSKNVILQGIRSNKGFRGTEEKVKTGRCNKVVLATASLVDHQSN